MRAAHASQIGNAAAALAELEGVVRYEPVAEFWPQFLRGCLKYRESLDRELPDAPRTAAEYEP